jgi:hypothetical protein
MPPCCVHMRRERESTLWPLLIRVLILSWGPTFTASCKPNYLPKAPSPNTSTLRVRVSIQKWAGGGDTQSISFPLKTRKTFIFDFGLIHSCETPAILSYWSCCFSMYTKTYPDMNTMCGHPPKPSIGLQNCLPREPEGSWPLKSHRILRGKVLSDGDKVQQSRVRSQGEQNEEMRQRKAANLGETQPDSEPESALYALTTLCPRLLRKSRIIVCLGPFRML